MDDHRSTIAYCIFLDPNLISWSSEKQRFVAQSNIESVYRALAYFITEIILIQQVLYDLHV